jgi:flavin reductase (DIM6/NTAB) family NADH-FMN oxidoreductase RutF
MHKTIEPTILYFGTPVALIRTLNVDGSPNLAPMSSAGWLGRSCMLGLG